MSETSDDAFVLKEEAATTHYPSGWPVERITFEASGKTPSKYGANVFRFSAHLTLPVILPRRGWEVVKKTKNYAYLRPPEAERAQPFQIDIAVPSPAEVLAIAQRSFERRQSWMGQLGEWPAWYLHERDTSMQEIWQNSGTSEIQSRLHKGTPQSSLSIGEWGIWQMSATKRDGDFEFRHAFGQKTRTDDQVTVALNPEALYEGAPKSVELTTYERNARARALCIAHFGSTCLACGLNYEEKFGPIGLGLIHVHHILPLAERSQEYQIDPIRDLVPLCATCHHVVHSRQPPFTIEEIKCAIERARSRQ